MAKRRSSPRKAATKSTKTRGTAKTIKPAKSAQVSARPAKKRASTSTRCTARRQRATATDSYLATSTAGENSLPPGCENFAGENAARTVQSRGGFL